MRGDWAVDGVCGDFSIHGIDAERAVVYLKIQRCGFWRMNQEERRPIVMVGGTGDADFTVFGDQFDLRENFAGVVVGRGSFAKAHRVNVLGPTDYLNATVGFTVRTQHGHFSLGERAVL